MSKRKRKGKSQSLSQRILWILSLVIVGSMVISLFIVALPSGTERVPTPLPTLTPAPTNTPPPFPTLGPTTPPESSPETTAPLVGPVLPTSTGVFTPTLEPTEPPAGPVLPTATPEATPTASSTPSASNPDPVFAVGRESLDSPMVFRQLLAAAQNDSSEFIVDTGDMVNLGTEQWQASWKSPALDS